MSGLIVGLALRHPVDERFNSTVKLVAVIYADHAWEDGTHAYPAVGTVATMAGVSERTVQRHLRTLEAMGMLIADGRGPRGQNRYKFPLAESAEGGVYLALGGDNLSPRQIVGGDMDSGDTDSGDTHVTRINNPSLTTTTTAGAVFAAYEAEIGPLTAHIGDALDDDIETYSAEWVLAAIAEASESNARNLKYMRAILLRWKREGFRSKKRRRKNGEKKSGNGSQRDVAVVPAQYSAADQELAEKIRQRRGRSHV